MIEYAIYALFVGAVLRAEFERCPVTHSIVHVCGACWLMRYAIVVTAVCFLKG